MTRNEFASKQDLFAQRDGRLVDADFYQHLLADCALAGLDDVRRD